jgi:hypothetical protein
VSSLEKIEKNKLFSLKCSETQLIMREKGIKQPMSTTQHIVMNKVLERVFRFEKLIGSGPQALNNFVRNYWTNYVSAFICFFPLPF